MGREAEFAMEHPGSCALRLAGDGRDSSACAGAGKLTAGVSFNAEVGTTVWMKRDVLIYCDVGRIEDA